MPFVPHPGGHTPPRAVFHSCDVTGAPGDAGPWVPPPESPGHEGGSPWPAMPRPVLQMAFWARISRLLLPGTASRRSTKTVPPRRSRVSGWSQPVHYLQIVAWIVFLTVVFTTFGIFIPLLPPEWRYIAYSVSFDWGHGCRLRGGGAPRGASSRPGSGPPLEVVRPVLCPGSHCHSAGNPTAVLQAAAGSGSGLQVPTSAGAGRGCPAGSRGGRVPGRQRPQEWGSRRRATHFPNHG